MKFTKMKFDNIIDLENWKGKQRPFKILINFFWSKRDKSNYVFIIVMAPKKVLHFAFGIQLQIGLFQQCK